MTDETRELFDAPWHPAEKPGDYAVSSDNGEAIVEYSNYDEKTTNRLARLPELYDALMETVYYKCFECMGGLRHNVDMTREELVKNGCPKAKDKLRAHAVSCVAMKSLDILKKVRNGE